jgi:RNA polymerase sigma factor (sigma-70 family)
MVGVSSILGPRASDEVGRVDTESDGELVRRSAAGDLEAFGAIYRRTSAATRRFLEGLRRPPDVHRVDDALQETYLRLFRGLAKVDAARPLLPWVLGIARLVALEQARGARPGEADLEQVPGSAEPIDGQAARAEEELLTARALEALAAEHRTVLVLRHALGLTMKELAGSLACSVPTARAHLRTAAHLFAVELRARGVLPRREETS